MLNRTPVIGYVADNGHKLYLGGSIKRYLPFPYPFTGTIKPAAFSLLIRLPAAVTESPVIEEMSERPKIPSVPMFLYTTSNDPAKGNDIYRSNSMGCSPDRKSHKFLCAQKSRGSHALPAGIKKIRPRDTRGLADQIHPTR